MQPIARGHSSKPLVTVSVIMSVYNGADCVTDAVESILGQTFGDFEFIIINDGSTDGTQQCLDAFDDDRLRVEFQENIGLTRSLNRALQISNGKFVARMDADDVALPQRLEKQVSYLDTHPDVVLLGTAWRMIDEIRQRELSLYPDELDSALRRAMARGNPFCHSSVMMRTAALRLVGGYDESFRYIQDYELWSRMAAVGKIANLPDMLMVRKFHLQGISADLSTYFYRYYLIVKARHLAIQRLGFPLSAYLTMANLLKFIPRELYDQFRARMFM